MRAISILLALSFCGTPTSALALPPDATSRGFVAGANHHLGDRGFIAAFGRAPRDGRDPEDARMWSHLAYVHDWLAQRPATHPDLAARRNELLGYLADYVTLGITPVNTVLPWRNPVFIDEHGQICAVGYLIERSTGRALPEEIAAREAYRYLEDIDVPGVAEWVATSGFTLEELASIQPGYQGPPVHLWRQDIRDFPNDEERFEGVVGNLRGGKMDGLWTVDREGATGRGEFHNGAGEWIGLVDGHLAVRGKYQRNQPQGIWQIFHPNGAVAAEGKFVRGVRTGTWSFYHPNGQLLSRGRFDQRGYPTGTWEIASAAGQTLAKTTFGRGYWSRFFGLPMPDAALVRDVDGVQHTIVNATLHMVPIDGMRFYATVGWDPAATPCSPEDPETPESDTRLFDDTGRVIVADQGTWKYGAERIIGAYRAAARRGDAARLYHGHRGCMEDCEMTGETVPFTEPAASTAMSAERIAAFEKARQIMCAAGPESHDLSNVVAKPSLAEDDADAKPETDWVRLRGETSHDVQWSHVDGLFQRAYRTLPNYLDPGF